MAPSSQCRCHCANIKVYRVDSLTSCHLVVVGTTSVVLQQWQYGVVWCRPKVSDVVQMEPGREPFSSKKRCRSIFECGWRSEIISNRVEIDREILSLFYFRKKIGYIWHCYPMTSYFYVFAILRKALTRWTLSQKCEVLSKRHFLYVTTKHE